MIDLTRRDVVGGIAATAALAPFAPSLARTPFPSFLVIGDWGRDGTQHQRDVAVQMGKTAAASGARFVLAVGDNFYESGVQSADDTQWQTSFEQVYTDPALQVPWHVALGNHDYRGNPQAQIDYMAKSARWKMPSRYYVVPSAQSGLPDTDIFVIDSSPLVHKYRDKVEAPIAQNVSRQSVTAQMTWLDRALGNSSAAWKLVVGHHTIRSGGSGHGDTPELVAMVKPLLERHGVQAYVNGHDHDMQHIVDNDVDYICCGAGSEVRPVRAVKGTKFCLSRSGFASIAIEGEDLALGFRDFQGAAVYQTVINRARGRVRPT